MEDPSIIAPFYSRCKIGELNGNEGDDGLDEHANKKPGVYFRSVGKSYFIQHLLNLYVTHQFVFEAKLTEKNIFNSGNRYLENSNIICINQNPGARTLDMSGWSGTCTRGRTSWGSRSGRGPSGTSGSPWSAPRPSSPSTSSSPHGKMSHLPAAFPSQDGR